MNNLKRQQTRVDGIAGSRSRGVLLLLLALCQASFGCQSSSEHADHGDEDEHASHVIPAHKPSDLPKAVARLRELNNRFVEDRSKGVKDQEQLMIALDIALWLPEIAADSDMPEGPWNTVAAESETIASVFRGLAEAGHSNAAGSFDDSSRSIAVLEQLLASGDPAWFPPPKTATPARPSLPESGG